MEMRILADTSAVMAVLLEEPSKEGIISLTQGASIVSSASLKWEIGNALSAMLKRRRIGEKEIGAALDAFSRIPIQSVDVDLETAMTLCAKHGISAYDAYFLAAAKQFRLPLLTLDKGMIEIAKKERIRILEG